MSKSRLSIVAMLPLLTACATVQPSVPKAVECPQLPMLPPMEAGVLEHDFIGNMRTLLQGKLP